MTPKRDQLTEMLNGGKHLRLLPGLKLSIYEATFHFSSSIGLVKREAMIGYIEFLHGLLELQHEFVHRRRIAEYNVGTRVLRMPEEPRVGDELESRRLDLRTQRLLGYAVIGLADSSAIFRPS